MKSKLTKQNKIELIANAPEVTNAIKILTALMIDAKIKNFVQYEYVINGKTYRFKYEKLKVEKFNSTTKLKQGHSTLSLPSDDEIKIMAKADTSIVDRQFFYQRGAKAIRDDIKRRNKRINVS